MSSPIDKQRGGALIEFALALPLLVACALPVFDYMIDIAAQTVLTQTAREAANLTKRPAQTYTAQQIMTSVSDSALPFDLKSKGALMITRIVGNQNCNADGEQCDGSVVEQTRWEQGTGLASKVWNGCLGWEAGSGRCSNLGGSPRVNLMQGQLYQGQVVVVAEAQYTQTPLIGALDLGFMGVSVPGLNPQLYASAIF